MAKLIAAVKGMARSIVQGIAGDETTENNLLYEDGSALLYEDGTTLIYED